LVISLFFSIFAAHYKLFYKINMILNNFVFDAYIRLMTSYVTIWLFFVNIRHNQDHNLTIALITLLILLLSVKPMIKCRRHVNIILRDYKFAIGQISTKIDSTNKNRQEREDELASQFDMLNKYILDNNIIEKPSKAQTETDKLINDCQNYEPFYSDVIQNQIIVPLIKDLSLIDNKDPEGVNKVERQNLIAEITRDIALHIIVGNPIADSTKNINLVDYLGITQTSIIIRNVAKRILIIYKLEKKNTSMNILDIMTSFVPALITDTDINKVYQSSTKSKAEKAGIKVNINEMEIDINNYIDIMIDTYPGVPTKIKRDSKQRRERKKNFSTCTVRKNLSCAKSDCSLFDPV